MRFMQLKCPGRDPIIMASGFWHRRRAEDCRLCRELPSGRRTAVCIGRLLLDGMVLRSIRRDERRPVILEGCEILAERVFMA